MAKRTNQHQHDTMVKTLVDHLINNGHSDVKADLKGNDRPYLIHWNHRTTGHIPDVTSTNKCDYIFEVETDDSIFDPHTEEQWKLFSANAEQHSKKFIVVVPKGSEDKAKLRAEELGLELDNIWTVR